MGDTSTHSQAGQAEPPPLPARWVCDDEFCQLWEQQFPSGLSLEWGKGSGLLVLPSPREDSGGKGTQYARHFKACFTSVLQIPGTMSRDRSPDSLEQQA